MRYNCISMEDDKFLKNQELKLHLRHFTIVGGYKREDNSQCSFL